MVTLRLTVEDLSRIRVVGTLGAEFESRLAELRYAEPLEDGFSEWRRQVERGLRRISTDAAPAPPSAPRAAAGPSPEGGHFRAAAVDPFWGRIHGRLETERELFGRTALDDGVESALGRLHPAIDWDAPHLRVDDGQNAREIRLTGEGFALAPSLFARRPLVLEPDSGRPGLTTLVYNVPLDTESASSLWRAEEDGAAALRQLLGHTRASVLESVRVPGSTGDISRRLLISRPSAGKHVSVLRRSGLVATERRSNLAVHRLTHLGEAVLGRPAVPAGPAGPSTVLR
ncbi:helix-turn-helix domain-containing protein [Streptomyces subrutilus]|uniref:helix-turn-helix domain-containing protein n=1 Tax=Streptomyces subrutilus TaxID=36818 RepID=UPI0033C99AA1